MFIINIINIFTHTQAEQVNITFLILKDVRCNINYWERYNCSSAATNCGKYLRCLLELPEDFFVLLFLTFFYSESLS